MSSVVTGIGITALFLWAATLPFIGKGNAPLWLVAILFLISLGMIAFGVSLVISALRGKLVLCDEYVELTEATTRRLRVPDILGYRVNPDGDIVEVHPKSNDRRPIYIDTSYGRIEQFTSWLAERLPDLDAQDAQAEEAEIVRDEVLGLDKENRLETVARARRWCAPVHLIAVGVSLWGYFYPRPYGAVIMALASTPIVAIVMLTVFNGAARLYSGQRSLYADVATAFMGPPIVLALRSSDWNLLEYGDLVGLGIGCGVAVVVAALVVARRAIAGPGQMVGLVFSALLWGWGVTVAANCLLDQARADEYLVTVRGKRVAGKRLRTYYLNVTGWGDRADANDVVVSKRQYGRAEVEGTAVVHVKPGALGSRWYIVKVGIPHDR